jgi:hypothetical protein
MTSMKDHPLAVTAYKCRCGRIHKTVEQATKCCACKKCGTPFEGGRQDRRTDCAHCMYGWRLREARKRVRRAKEELADAEKGLQQLLDGGKPEKGSR